MESLGVNMKIDEAKATNLKTEKKVFLFSAEKTEGEGSWINRLGGKGANLAEMSRLKIPVPPGFTIATNVCQEYNEAGGFLSEEVQNEVRESLTALEVILGRQFGSNDKPLLLSIRSGARVSMPGMMDTVLNLGLNDQTVAALARISQDGRFAWDSYRRFIQMYGQVVLGLPMTSFDDHLEGKKQETGVNNDAELSEVSLRELVDLYKEEIALAGKVFPEDPWEQLWGAIGAVFKSWQGARAVAYRNIHGIPGGWGTAVNVQAMVFGNFGENSATGVAFSRNPSTGENTLYGEFLINAQGEDVVAGIRTPSPLTVLEAQKMGLSGQSLEEKMPEIFSEFRAIANRLEEHYRDMQDMEFTVERGQLWMLQTRSGKRTGKAALQIAVNFVEEGRLTEKEALLSIHPKSLDQLLHPSLDPSVEKTLLCKGLPASPGGVSGRLVFTSEQAVEWKERGERVILARIETSPEDILGMDAALGILTSRGGMTSHAAVVARGMGKCCVAGAQDVLINMQNQTMKVSGYVLNKGDFITLDGSSGEVFLGEVPTVEPKLDSNFERVMEWAAKVQSMAVRTNADTPKDAKIALNFGCEGIGLCRTEHMFFGADRIDVVRKMILAEEYSQRLNALEELLPMQKGDFFELFQVMKGYPVTIRLLDPPLHEFLPQGDKDIEELANRLEMNPSVLRGHVQRLHEFNPMLGHRGCRLAVSYPEIYIMQVRAIALAMVEIHQRGIQAEPEIMVPLIMNVNEFQIIRAKIESTMYEVFQEAQCQLLYTVGTMIELPRAVLTADKIADKADFFSFGTNDLTQTTLGLSRDDSARFLDTYVSEGIFEQDPFQSIDREGVGSLVRIAVELGRGKKPGIKLGVCGEHGGDPASIEFFHSVGLDYVSCSPYRVPLARLAVAQSAIRAEEL